MHMHTKSTNMHNDGNVKSRGPNVKRLKSNTVEPFLFVNNHSVNCILLIPRPAPAAPRPPPQAYRPAPGARRTARRLLVDLKGVMCLWPKTERNGVSVLGWLNGETEPG
jgi:hypothetical protein